MAGSDQANRLAARFGDRGSALIALALTASAPIIGTTTAMVLAPGALGHAMFILCKVWLLSVPAVWYLCVERGRPSCSRPRHGGMLAGAGLGLALAGCILAGFWFIARPRLDPELLNEAVAVMGLATPTAFIAAALYWIVVNSSLEEYAFRWFIFTQCERLMPGWAAIIAAAAIFTAHHVVALSVYLDPVLTILGSVGIFVGGALWSWCYLRYRSIWPGWLSHACADVAVFSIGWYLVFGL